MVGQGTATYTVASIMERLYQQYLTPPDNQDVQVWLGASITDTDTTIELGSFAIPEDEALLRQGVQMELGQELVRVLSYDNAIPSVEVVREDSGTVAVAHDTPTLMKVSPSFTRASIFEAVADNIALLHPKLFTVAQEYMPHLGDGVYALSDQLVTDIISIWADNEGLGGSFTQYEYDYNGTINITGELVSYHPLVGGRAIICYAGDRNIWARLRRRTGRPTSETDTLEAVGVDPRWVNIVMAGAAADLMVGRDVPATQTEWVKSVLEAENIRVGTRMSIAAGLRQYRNMLLADTEREISTDNRPRIRIRDALRQAQ